MLLLTLKSLDPILNTLPSFMYWHVPHRRSEHLWIANVLFLRKWDLHNMCLRVFACLLLLMNVNLFRHCIVSFENGIKMFHERRNISVLGIMCCYEW
jgi:hypothetical protein